VSAAPKRDAGAARETGRDFPAAARHYLLDQPWPAAERMTKHVRFETSLGDFTVELYEDEAPATVENFLRYVDDGHFDGTVFHRVIPGFVVQGGGMTAEMRQKPTRAPIRNEADNGLKNRRGTLSMARTNDPNSATSQFFVNLVDNIALDPGRGGAGYAVFGCISDGMAVVDQMAKARTGNKGMHQDVPLEPILVKKAGRVPEDA
jgi:peptidyl-prolyl cis-trans isomerase A (cyclophilin A)